jgi:hypothetical protein
VQSVRKVHFERQGTCKMRDQLGMTIGFGVRCSILSLMLGASAATACSSNNDGDGEGDGTGAQRNVGTGGVADFGGGAAGAAAQAGVPNGFGASSGAAGNGGGAGGGNGVGPNACQPQGELASCVGERYAGENIPLDIYIMFDVSCSMSCPVERTGTGQCCMGDPNGRIHDVRAAVTEFLNDPNSAGIGVGISYFGYMQSGDTSCDPSDYSVPAVTVGRLPEHTGALLNSLNAVQPTGETPTGAAIRGACTYASQWKASHPGHAVATLLVTDGVPEAPNSDNCNPSLEDAVQAAATCSGQDPSLPLYVLGVGRALPNLNSIADAGGTGRAYLAEGNVSLEVLAALNEIREIASIPCELQIPPAPSGTTINYLEINVSHCNSAGSNSNFVYVETPDRCDTDRDGWYYDDPADPRQILLCERACNRVTDPGGSLVVTTGCDTVMGPR